MDRINKINVHIKDNLGYKDLNKKLEILERVLVLLVVRQVLPYNLPTPLHLFNKHFTHLLSPTKPKIIFQVGCKFIWIRAERNVYKKARKGGSRLWLLWFKVVAVIVGTIRLEKD